VSNKKFSISIFLSMIDEAIAKRGAGYIIKNGVTNPKPHPFINHAICFQASGPMTLEEQADHVSDFMQSEVKWLDGRILKCAGVEAVTVGNSSAQMNADEAAFVLSDPAPAQLDIERMRALADLRDLQGAIRLHYAVCKGEEPGTPSDLTPGKMLDYIAQRAELVDAQKKKKGK